MPSSPATTNSSSSEPPRPLQATADVSDANPCQYSSVTVHVHLSRGDVPVGDAAVSSSWHFRTTTSSEPGTTDSDGDAYLTRRISSATAGYYVEVDVIAQDGGDYAHAATGFTPQKC